MFPPWKQFPNIPRGSIGWRMGAGEQYKYRFLGWYLALSDSEAELYVTENPEPEEWCGYCKSVRDNARR